MKRYLIKATSEFNIDEDELKDYINNRNEEWGEDKPEEIEKLINNGRCVLKDDKGTTHITVLKVEDKQ
jgi:hypothetical protein